MLLINGFQLNFEDYIAELATRALLYEVSTTPKPGLVDRISSGAHKDMNFFTFLDSTCSLIPFWREFTCLGMAYSSNDFEYLFLKAREIGQRAEKSMFFATNNINTQKGAIFCIGLLCVSAGYIDSHSGMQTTVDELLQFCGKLSSYSLSDFDKISSYGTKLTNGEKLFLKHGETGIRGEASRGFPNVHQHSLPVLKSFVKKGAPLNDAAVAALLHLIVYVDDTNMFTRAPLDLCSSIKLEIEQFLSTDPTPVQVLKKASSLEPVFVNNNVSIGGCADLLAITYFLYFWETSRILRNEE